MRMTYTVITGSISSSQTIFCYSFAVDCLVVGFARYGALWTGLISLDRSLINFFFVLVRTKCLFCVSSDLDRNCGNWSRWILYFSGLKISLCQHRMSFVSFFLWIACDLPSVEACQRYAYDEQDRRCRITPASRCMEKRFNIYYVWCLRYGGTLSKFSDASQREMWCRLD